jgi:integrase
MEVDMAKRATRFTDRAIQALKPKEKVFLVSDIDRVYVRTMPTGRKTFMTVYTFEGRQRWLTVGIYPDTSLRKARTKIKEIHEKVENDIDPTLAKQIKRAEQLNAPTVTDFAEVYLKKWATPKKKTAKEDERILRKDVLPVMGARKLKDIRRTEIIHLLDDIAERGPIMANRTLAVIRKMFNFAVNRGVIELSPCQNITPPGKEVKKNRVLSDAEIKVLWPKMDELLTDQANRALKLILMTGQRPGEVTRMHWDEVEGQWWTIPAEKTKNGKEHRVFLNSTALELMGEPKKKGFVFPSYKKEKQPAHPNAFGNALRNKMEKFKNDDLRVGYFTPHDLRRTAATMMASLGYGSYVVGKILNHTDPSVTAIYNRYEYDKEKQAALEALDRKIIGIITGKKVDNVIPMAR